MEVVLFMIVGYLCGSIPFGLLLTKAAGLDDIRTIGSGNIGATNVLRTGRKGLALATLILDGGKGACAVLLLGYAFELFDYQNILMLIGFAACLGHCFPLWLKFKGGKGVATTLGTLLAAIPVAGGVTCLTWLITAILFRYSSLAALVAVLVAPFAAAYFYGLVVGIFTVPITILIWVRHHANIRRLLKGEEPKIGRKK